MTTTTKTILITILIAGVMLSGCIGSESTKEQIIVDESTPVITSTQESVLTVDVIATPRERTHPTTTTSREEAKRICEENGVVWGCDDPVVTPTAVPTPTAIPTAIPTPKPTIVKDGMRYMDGFYISHGVQINGIIPSWNNNTIIITGINQGQFRDSPFNNLVQLEFVISGETVMKFEPTFTNSVYGLEITEFPAVITLPDGIYTDSMTSMDMIGTFDDYGTPSSSIYLDGEYRFRLEFQKPPQSYEKDYQGIPAFK